VKTYWQILRALARRIGLFTGLLLCIPLTVRLVGLLEPTPRAAMITLAFGLPMILWFAGGLIGSAATHLLGGSRATLIPGYQRRVLAVAVLLGLGLWALVPLYYLAGGFVVDEIAWLRWVPLWSYGLLGLGFIGGALQPDLGIGEGMLTWSRGSWARQLLLILVWLMPTLIAFNPPLRDWLNTPLDAELPGITLMAVLCLMLGPLSWPAVLRLVQRVRWETPAVRRNWSEQLRAGTPNSSAWGLPAIARRLHGKGRLRIEFLVFQPGLLGLGVAGAMFPVFFLGFLLVFGGLAPTGMGAAQLMESNLPALLFGILMIPVTPILAGAIDIPRLGRSLLLPGQFRRASLPTQLFKRLLAVWIGGVLAAMVPAAAIALWFGTPASALGWTALLLLWGICLAVAVEFFRASGAAKKTAGDPVRIAFGMGLFLIFGLAKPFFFDVYSALVCLGVMALAFVAPVLLYHLGLKRWTTMEYGA
jgi:hypothetical protein